MQPAKLGLKHLACIVSMASQALMSTKVPGGALAELQALCQWFWWGGFLLRTNGSADSLVSRAHCEWLIHNSSLIGRQEWFSILPMREGRHGGIENFSQRCTVGKRWWARIWTLSAYLPSDVICSALICHLKSEAIHEVVQGSKWRLYSCMAHPTE